MIENLIVLYYGLCIGIVTVMITLYAQFDQTLSFNVDNMLYNYCIIVTYPLDNN